jgi:hypothetical protein
VNLCLSHNYLKKWITSLLFIIFSSASYGQHEILDSIKTALNTPKPRFIFAFHNRNTFIQSDRTKLYGIAAGLDFNEKLNLTVGLYGFGRASETLLQNNINFTQDTVYRYINTTNTSLGIEYDYYHKGRLSLSVPLQIGLGNVAYRYTQSDKSTDIRTDNYRVVPIEVGTNAYYELLPWIGLKGGIGYRLAAGPKESRRLTSPYYNLGIAILVGEIYKDLKSKIED